MCKKTKQATFFPSGFYFGRKKVETWRKHMQAYHCCKPVRKRKQLRQSAVDQ
jgi:hypothetical protein